MSLFHVCDAETIFDVGDRRLLQCTCGKKWSILFNYDTGRWQKVEGNFIVPPYAIVVILAGTQDEYNLAVEVLVSTMGFEKARVARLTEDTVHQLMYQDATPFVYFVGTWYEQDDLLSNENVLAIINRRMR